MEYHNYKLIRDIKKIRSKYSQNYANRDHLQPVISAVSSSKEIEQIFSIPFKNCVGTFYVGNGITSLECSGEIAKSNMVFPSYPVEPDQIFYKLPVNAEEIIWGKSLVFAIVNFKKHKELGFGNDLDRSFSNIAVVDNDSYTFLLKLELSSDTYEYKIIKLHKLEYSSNKEWGNYDEMAYLPADEKLQSDLDYWNRDSCYFFYNTVKKSIQCYNNKFELTKHSLLNVIGGYPFPVRFMLIHPVLPFAIITGLYKGPSGFDDQAFHLVRWNVSDEKQRLIPYPFKEVLGLQNEKSPVYFCNMTFSPDGNWLILQDGTIDDKNPEIVAIPIQKDNPMYLGKPVFLGKAFREGATLKSFSWIEDPMTYVICDGKLLYSWELGKIKDRLEYKK
jgi:hypothetical protein